MSLFVGRVEAVTELLDAYEAAAGRDRALPQRAGLVLVAGEAGMGKTSLLTAFATAVASRGGCAVWGSCWDADQAPALWPWSQALRTMLTVRPDLRSSLDPELSAVLPHPLTATALPSDSDAGSRLRIFDAVGRLLARAAAAAPVVVILDDLQWSDRSSVDLIRFLLGSAHFGSVLLVGAFRPEEVAARGDSAVVELTTVAEAIELSGLSRTEVTELLRAVIGGPAADQWSDLVHARTDGHPFFARELGHLLASGGGVASVPLAVHGTIAQRLTRLSPACVEMLESAAVSGTTLAPDLLAAMTMRSVTEVAELIAQAAAAGFLASPGGRPRFAHDLYRETLYASLAPSRRLELHRRAADALADSRRRGSPVFAAELARQYAAAVPLVGADPALAWARAAAADDVSRYAFTEAAGQLARARSAIVEAGQSLPEAEAVDLITAEADLRLRAGQADAARELLDAAWARALPVGDPVRVSAVALGLDRVGARFAMPRTQLIAVLDRARAGLAGSQTATEAQVTAALARQLQHSVPQDRPRARPLAEEAVALARAVGNPVTLASCLLAHHDVLWTAGTARQRERIAGEIGGLAGRAGDSERQAQALLLTATAQLENGSPAFRATLAEYGYVTERLREPRHDYLLRTRQAALALLDGDIEAGDRLSIAAAALGEEVGDTDTGNVRMTQRLEVTRARGVPEELRTTASEAVRWWVGLPAHAHAVAAGFLARAGDLNGARRELDIVLALDGLRTDRSYMWSLFVGEITVAAIALDDRALCRQLLAALTPFADSCAVGGALVSFMGCHAHRVGLLRAALGETEAARQALCTALEVHRRLGAPAWEAETCAALAALGGDETETWADRGATIRADLGLPATPIVRPAVAIARLRQVSGLWEATFRGQTAYLREAKGLHDLATLLARPGNDVPALELAGAKEATGGPGAPVLDRTALSSYRRRLADLDEERDSAERDADLGRLDKIRDERDALLSELRRATRPGGGSRSLGPSTAERARKAVTARIRDAIQHIGDALPEFGAHLDRTVRTGTSCRYDPERH